MLTQDNKRFSIHTPLGKDILLLARFRGQEAVSEMFRFDIELFSEQQSIPVKDIIGRNVTISLTPAQGGERFFNGLISSFTQEYPGDEPGLEGQQLFRYSAVMVPGLWLLTRTSDSRIFQKMNVPEILEKVFSDNEFTDYLMDFETAGYEEREYTVQYNETDFNFISRLLEEEGIFYFFEHADGRHRMVMKDSPSSDYCIDDGDGEIRFQMGERGPDGEEESIESLKMAHRIKTGKYTLKDYNFEIPDTDLEVTYDTTNNLGPGERERYHYPGRYAKREAGDNQASLRMEEEEARISVLSGKGNCTLFSSGSVFELKESYQEDWNDKEYLITRVLHKADQADSYFSGLQVREEETRPYENHFECMDNSLPYRPRRLTPVPVIDGVQTAFVVGPGGEEIYTDEHGRVKVQFHWDREGKYDENTSCWLRVAQSMAGQGWGSVFLPRIGHEVIVEFIEGNPDRPIVTGQVYHGVNTPPYSLPDEKTKTTFKSSSSLGGEGFNEIRFEDEAGEEQIFIHAQKNFDLRIGNDRYETVDNDRHLHVTNDKFETVENFRHETVTGDHMEEIESDRHLDVKGKEAKQVGGSKSLTVKGDVIEVFKAGHSEQTTGDYYLKAKNVVIEGMENITLSVGGSYIAVESGSIEIKTGGDVTINGTNVSIAGSAGTEITGGTVKIN
ncbi:type VI secretion system Vgr family protein [Desulfospira joergensenii]|uniref:type VI secretion system Vgr family protein n=1 Tax=Desulfospira joergensenii TaxID=53329 RepID=UPI0003B669C9|nr:type VI secretion system tip protein VgrG [Desulfospira joergensenii]